MHHFELEIHLFKSRWWLVPHLKIISLQTSPRMFMQPRCCCCLPITLKPNAGFNGVSSLTLWSTHLHTFKHKFIHSLVELSLSLLFSFSLSLSHPPSFILILWHFSGMINFSDWRKRCLMRRRCRERRDVSSNDATPFPNDSSMIPFLLLVKLQRTLEQNAK